LIVLLDQVTDPHNVGAILRSAAVFGARAVVMTERNAPAQMGTLAKSASGALERVALVRVVNLARTIEELREADYWCVGLAEEGGAMPASPLPPKIALVMGAEGDGLRRLTKERCDALAALPGATEFTTLNVSNAAAVALYHLFASR
jgi:23S rRNA (guanosine2251-2'-O)-methyltransferase